MTKMLKDMAFGFEYEILYECEPRKNFVSFTKLKNAFKTQQNKVPKDEQWKVVDDASLKRISGQETWKRSEDSDFIYGTNVDKHTLCYDHDQIHERDTYSEYDGTAEIVSPVIKGYDAIAPAFSRFDTLLKTVESNLKISFFNNSLTSNHVHLSHPLMLSLQGAVKVFMAWLYFEPLFVAMVGSRRGDNAYCARTQMYWKTRIMKNLFMSIGKVVGRGTEDVSLSNFKALLKDLEKLFKVMPRTNPEYMAEFWASMTKGLKEQGLAHLQTDAGEVDVKNLLDEFVNSVGNQTHRERRFVALNMTNLANNDENKATIEVRLKHGSNNMDANAKWVQLLAAFFAAALDNVCVTTFFDLATKQRFYDILMRSCANNICANDAAFLKTQLSAFMRPVWADGVKEALAYWLKKIQTTDDPVAGIAAPVDVAKKKSVTKSQYEAAKAKGAQATKSDVERIKLFEEAQKDRDKPLYGGGKKKATR